MSASRRPAATRGGVATSKDDMLLHASMLFLLTALAAHAPVTSMTNVTKTWVEGEMGYRITTVPDGSPAARHGLRSGDILAEPRPLPDRLRESGPDGVNISLYRFDTAKTTYAPTTIKIVFLAGEEKRLGTTGDLGFLVTAVQPGSLGARAELKPGDFIPKINDTFVHADADLKLVDDAYERGEQVLIRFTRWYPESGDFKDAISRRRFVK
jgi:S1-C subfamily serine protease